MVDKQNQKQECYDRLARRRGYKLLGPHGGYTSCYRQKRRSFTGKVASVIFATQNEEISFWETEKFWPSGPFKSEECRWKHPKITS